MTGFRTLAKRIKVCCEQLILANERKLAAALAQTSESQPESDELLIEILRKAAARMQQNMPAPAAPEKSDSHSATGVALPVAEVEEEEARAASPAPEAACPVDLPDPLELATRPLIGLCDYVFATIEESDDPVEAEFARRLFLRLKKIFGVLGMEIIDDRGVFNISSQEVLDSETTLNAADHDCVKTTAALGYRRNGRLIRRQGVILYRYSPAISIPLE